MIAAGCVLGALALTLVAGGVWALWLDQMGRDSGGFVSTGPLKMRTETYAIVGDLRGDGPAWLYSSAVLGHTRVVVSSQTSGRIFVGIARTGDVDRYLNGVAYATIDHFGTSAATTHRGAAPSQRPADTSIWAESTVGTGQVRLPWTPQAGDWRIVVMNADATTGVAVRGTLGAKLPVLRWLAAGLLLAGAAAGTETVLVARRLVRQVPRDGNIGKPTTNPNAGPPRATVPSEPALPLVQQPATASTASEVTS